MQYRVNFFDKHGDETRTLTVDAANEDNAEEAAAAEADARGWPASFKVADAELISVPNDKAQLRSEAE